MRGQKSIRPRRAARLFTLVLAAGLILATPWFGGDASARAAPPQGTDSRFDRLPADWSVVSHEDWFWASSGGGKLLDPVAAHIDARLAEVRSAFGIRERRPLLFLWSPDRTEFKQRVQDLGGARPGAFVQAIAFPGQSVVVLDASRRWRDPPTEVRQTITHEIVHAVLGGAGPLPRWYHEGWAQRIAEQWPRPEETELLASYADSEDLVSLVDLDEQIPSSHSRLGLFYKQALLFVAWLEREGGLTTNRELLQKVQQGVPFDEAFESAYGRSVRDSEALWQSELAAQAIPLGWLLRLIANPLILAGFVVAAAFFFETRRRRKKLRAWKRAEAEADARAAGIEFDSDHRGG